jgi:hypothetical protein
MVVDESRLADRASASGTKQKEILTGFRLFRDSFPEQGYDPSLELYHTAAS